MAQILLSLASRQIWPQVLTVAHLKPGTLVLLHSPDVRESKNPAQRLKSYFGKIGGPEVKLEEIPSDNFSKIKKRFSEIAEKYRIGIENGRFHFTGGNKLMATAAYEWAKEKKWRSCYLEKRNTLYQFQANTHGSDYSITSKNLDAHLVGNTDPIDLLTAQLDEALVQHAGELLTLNDKGREITIEDLSNQLKKQPIHQGFQYSTLVNIAGKTGRQNPVAGDNLEYATAVVVLKHGIPMVRKGVKLKSSQKSNVTESEIDVVFNWKGRLWMADCKAKSSGASKLRKLEDAMRKLGWDPRKLTDNFNKLKGQLADTEARLLKEDIQQISEMGGLLGSAFAIRMQGLPDDVMRFAHSRRPKVEVVHLAEMMVRLPAVLE